MAGSNSRTVRILVTPLGNSIGILKPPIAKWQPDVIFAFTSMSDSISMVEDHLRNSWSRFCGANGLPDIRGVFIDEPWQATTIQDMMEAFDRVVSQVEDEFCGNDVEWHVGIAGGTNLMPVALSFSASTYSYPVYYVLPEDRYPKLVNTPEKLVLEIPVFELLGPGVQYFTKSPTASKVFSIMNSKGGPITVDALAQARNVSDKATYPYTSKMMELGLIAKVGNDGYETTTVGRLAYDRSRGLDKT